MTTIAGNNVGSVSQSTTGSSDNKWLISDVAYSYMRAKTITFTAEGLKPNTRYYPFFDDIYVGQYCSSVSGQTSSEIKTNAQGNIVANFYLPSKTFLCGRHIFKLVDNIKLVDDSYVADPVYGSAETTYESSGVLKTLQTLVTSDSAENLQVEVPPVVESTDPTTGVSIIKPTPIQECESWYFEYTVGSYKQETFTVDTNSSAIPTNPRPITGGTDLIEDSITYISTTPIGGGRYQHTFSYRTPGTLSKVFTQEWVGNKDPINSPVSNSNLPSLTSFRPSGLKDEDTVTITKQWTYLGTAVCPVNSGLKTLKKPDPLAQSFRVDENKYPDGIFVTSITLYFKTVDQGSSVILELRQIENGVPGSNTIPGSKVVMPGFGVSQSSNATAGTNFKFDRPIFLIAGKEYCFIVKSTSLGYNIWTSREGELDITSNTLIDEQPFDGMLYKSVSDSTWTPEPLEDIKFTLNIAVFNTAIDSKLVFNLKKDENDRYYSTKQILPLWYMSTVEGTNTVKIKIPSHGLETGDSILIRDITNTNESFNNIAKTNLLNENGHVITKIDNDHVSIVADNNADISGTFGVPDAYEIIDNEPPIYNIPTQITAAPSVINSDNNSPSAVPAPGNTLMPPIPVQENSDRTFAVYTNIPVSELLVDYIRSDFPKTEITEEVSLVVDNILTKYAIENQNSFLEVGDNAFILSKINESNNNNLKLELSLATNNKYITPYVDISNMSVMTRSYKIDNQNNEIENTNYVLADLNDSSKNSEILSNTGIAAAKYKSTINETASETNKITVFVTANAPGLSKIDAYIRISNDKDTHEDLEWKWMLLDEELTSDGKVKQFSGSPDTRVLKEWMWVFESQERFSIYDIKLVMRSTNTSDIPKIFGIRAITDIID